MKAAEGCLVLEPGDVQAARDAIEAMGLVRCERVSAGPVMAKAHSMSEELRKEIYGEEGSGAEKG